MMSFLPRPETMRIVLPVLFVVGYVGYHAIRWRRGRRVSNGKTQEAGRAPKAAEGAPTGVPAAVIHPPVVRPPVPSVSPGESLYVQAREIPHQEIPDFENDGEYLDLLKRSADEGFAPAMAKLGEYALRREALVEAFHWFTKAKDAGMRNLDPTLLQIRVGWAMARRPEQFESVNEIFTESDRAAAVARLVRTNQK